MAGFLAQKINIEGLTAEAYQVFSSINNTLDQSDINLSFTKLHKSYRQYIRSWWEIASYETYIQQGLVYRGLRIPLRPGVHLDNQEFIQGWDNLLTESSLKLIKLLLEFEKKQIAVIGEELEQNLKDIQQFNSHPQFQALEARLQNNIETLKSEIKTRKHKKFLRDYKDFETKQIYTWKQFQSRQGEPLYTDISESDTSGTEEVQSEYSRHNYRRQGNRGRGQRGGRKQKGRGKTPREQPNTQGQVWGHPTPGRGQNWQNPQGGGPPGHPLLGRGQNWQNPQGGGPPGHSSSSSPPLVPLEMQGAYGPINPTLPSTYIPPC